MLYFLYEHFYSNDSVFSFLRLFRYLTFRIIYAMLTAFLISIILGRPVIRWLKEKNIKDTSREELAVIDASKKEGTPTMGGILIVFSILIPAVLWCNLSNRFIQIIITTTLWFSVVGYYDDLLKIKYKNKDGLSIPKKLFCQFVFSFILGVLLISDYSPFWPTTTNATLLNIPFYKYPITDLNWFYIPFVIFVVIATSNAVNFVDGLDGLAIGPIILSTLVFGVFSYVLGNMNLSQYFQFNYIKGTGELSVFCAAVIGAGIGFLWYNAYPAQLFMGDMGSMTLGGIIAVIAIMVKQEVLIVLAGMIFFIEGLTVFLQMISINYIGRRLFFMAPLHHTFQKRGIAEPKVVIRFWIVALIFALIALSTLKIR
ncbi:MAG: phospho-N-acetylmuramoyl-pentapeptide-transferase [Candidatus Schekmanbacteria bacterium RIFCSPHIGHO2_02_FULL_38_11]|uniref:Phospho-N-acetylmuramoyl-pentapeptide-transferase n=1 Tax=Candidatus Schekmanbacteria bacterium RIFCSPLOWO2_12_FULL_38_15 TaxID=1817883 RepID=A0A1F7SL94_9BACT|nr:MAG: phospho-N-acetylmuramoyl-pentapeptide-transferase [Candidatus Schekmanbacteria bacterium GWA2_38_9]OGL47959.1 MAG: phospho-N-acetylmuramoyl-pentapeptide-transferase [Candidatus Schekmanbacteria bacterium RIFCSPLOWO2_02_FULL_38_14]OGL49024.1 MAG: phospho-N-acetylmuramoyl-pentapeptide-transferase [Candidatus Schekmanbacteria bacterium RIFCSPHIGHO2_02_FULL_38_11]OGL54556.1 MAG: phospho-N-acetylmuramoyl-pentapeptide-transferase [Candidatus Schekmanbacteria bacterium RIFCSPLOWO2_12_FULL_38_15